MEGCPSGSDVRTVIRSWSGSVYRTPMKSVLEEIAKERQRQDDKWGEQNHPSVDHKLKARGPERLCEEYEIPSESRAKFMCDLADERKELTWAHIAVEELSEVVAAPDEQKRREELVQLAAVVVAWIERIDRGGSEG